ncbi:flavin reductase [Nocardioides sp. NPDC057767]|uniref:flavin reductase n=1 Tax=unclassified Nocardioides TaxID=2615069 RepID=UPI003670F824
MPDPTDSSWFREVLGQYPTGVCAITAADTDGARAGFVVGSFTSVSLDPPLVAFFPDKRSTSWPKIERAGRFCVNILSAEQEHVCRQFATPGHDKFKGLKTSTTPGGSPLIDGVVAWVECDLESVTEAGDHYIVLGRVRELDVASPALPLLFYQGGYGRFSPLSLAASGRGALSEQLQQVDLLRTEMESLADELSARCVATTVVDDELIVLASASSPVTRSRPTPVGVHLPFAPPYGAAFAAWSDDAAVDRWVGLLPDESAQHEQRRRLDVVRERGYSIGLWSQAQRDFAVMVDKMVEDPESVDQEGLLRLASQQAFDPVVLDQRGQEAIRLVAVPVFGDGGKVPIALTVYGFPRPADADEVEARIARIVKAGQHASELLGGRTPVPS